MPKRLPIRLLIILAFALGTTGCSTIGKPFFYRVTHENGSSGYILGTMHLGVPIEDLPSSVTSRFEESKPVYLEVDITSTSPLLSTTDFPPSVVMEDLQKSPLVQEIAQSVRNNPKNQEEKALYERLIKAFQTRAVDNYGTLWTPAKFENRQTLKSRLAPDFWAEIVRVLKPVFLTEETIEKLHIETVLTFLSNRWRGQVLVTAGKYERLQPKWSMDYNLTKIAKNHRVPVRVLDDHSFWSESCRAEYYLSSIEEILGKTTEMSMDEFDQLEDIYRSGDAQRVHNHQSQASSKKLYQCMIVDRNLKWIPKIDQEIKKARRYPSPFFAMGAGHLFGPSGVLDLLKKKGYRVDRITE